jgi:hypothetical protein
MSGIYRRAGPVAERHYVLSPYDEREAMTVSAAAKLANLSTGMIRNWCGLHEIGRRLPAGTGK